MGDDLTPEEVEEAISRVLADGAPELQTDESIEESLAESVAEGLMTRIDGPDGPRYALTDAGRERAESIMREALDGEPPRADAEAHMYLHLQQVCEDEALEVFFAAGKDILRLEHYRLADRLEGFAGDWAKPLADLIRRGVL